MTLRLPLLLAFTLAVPPIAAVPQDEPRGAETEGLAPLSERLDLSHRQAGFDLPHRLDEISGLAFDDDGHLFANGDERGIVYGIDPDTGDVDHGFALGSASAPVRGDFEGLAIVGDRYFLVSSKGLLYEFRRVAEGNASPIRVSDAGVGPSCEIEGLAFESATNSLLIACKRVSPRADEIRIHRLPIDPAAPVPPPLRIPYGALGPFGLRHGLHPSGIDVDPATGNLVVVAAEEAAIVELSPDGRVLSAYELPHGRHPQAEGIGFGPDGRLYISDEGHGRRARLTVYGLREDTSAGGKGTWPAG